MDHLNSKTTDFEKLVTMSSSLRLCLRLYRESVIRFKHLLIKILDGSGFELKGNNLFRILCCII